MSNENQNNGAKISGYLEKKGKMRMVSTWKKYWFVLEGRLLLYYRSQAEYDAISPCKGSISLGPPCSLKPAIASSCVFQLESRANTVTLRAENRFEQDKWMQALLTGLNQNLSHSSKMCHFRYSADDLVPLSEKVKRKQKSTFSRQNTLPERLVITNEPENEEKILLKRMKSLRAHSYGGSLQSMISQSNKGSPRLPTNDNIKRLLKSTSLQKVCNISDEELSSNESTNFADSKTFNSSQEQLFCIQIDDCPMNHETKFTDNSSQIKRKDHIYDEIDNSYLSILVESSEYCSIVENVDFNKNKTTSNERCDQFDADLCKEPMLPPRSQIQEELMGQKPVDETILNQPKKLSKLAKIVQDSKKGSKKRSSFVVRMLKKMKKSNDKSFVKQNKMDDQVEKDIIDMDELQILLENKKHCIEEKIKSNEKHQSPNKIFPTRKPHQVATFNTNNDDPILPCLPPKKRYVTEIQRNMSLNIPRPKLRERIKTPTKTVQVEDDKLKTIDEILDELDKENNRGLSKVKNLVVMFNDNYGDEQVEMRKKSDDVSSSRYRYSDDLNSLLDKLCEVTNAPVLKPGETSSLVVTPTPDHEWKNLARLMVRRLSEPDYDIPRPHSALQILPTLNIKENPMKPTRFFGPVLIDGENNIDDGPDKTMSFTPDSLESENKLVSNSSIEGERSLFSYTSHSYSRPMKTLDRKIIKSDNIVYVRPPVTEMALINECEHINNNDDNILICTAEPNINIEYFEDSLEPLEIN